jgi:hypothetical protein
MPIKFFVIILANGMTDIAGDAPQLFIFTLIRDLDEICGMMREME